MEIVKTININGSHIESESASTPGTNIRTNNFALESSNAIESKSYDSNITYKAIKVASKHAERDLKKFFKKTGYVVEKRSLKGKSIFAINIGEENGIKEQDNVEVVRIVSNHNPLTDEDEEIQEKICTGTIADKVFEKRSWVVFEKHCQNKIRLGDKTEITY